MAEAINPAGLERVVTVPVPPSKTRGHPEYDDRVLKVAQKKLGDAMITRELIEQIDDRESAHGGGDRLTPAQHAANYHLDKSLLDFDPRIIIVFDDVITTGSSYMGMRQVLSSAYPDAEVVGWFIARCVHDDGSDEYFDIVI